MFSKNLCWFELPHQHCALVTPKIGEMLLQGQGRLNYNKAVGDGKRGCLHDCPFSSFQSSSAMSSSLPYLVLHGARLEFLQTQKEWEVVFQHIGDTHEIGTSLSLGTFTNYVCNRDCLPTNLKVCDFIQ